MTGNRFVHQEPLLGQFDRYLVLGEDVLLDAHVDLGGGVTSTGRDLPHTQVGLAGKGQLHRSHAELICGDGLLEDLDRLGILDLDSGLRGHRLQLRVQGHEAHQDRLARLVDGLVGLQKEEGALLDLDLSVVPEAWAADHDLVVAVVELGDLQFDGALTLDPCRGLQHGLALLAQGYLHICAGQIVAVEQG